MKRELLVHYEKLNYLRYQKRILELFHNPDLQVLGIERKILGKTSYGYDLDCITIGYGEKELFLVGGTHGSEVISVDFLLHFIASLPTFQEFDPNEFKLIIMPLQNPEGFDISTNTFRCIKDEQFLRDSYEYYLRYWTDSVIVNAFQAFRSFLEQIRNKRNLISSHQMVVGLQNFVQSNPHWKKLSNAFMVPDIMFFNHLVFSLQEIGSYQTLQQSLLQICNATLKHISRCEKFSEVTILFIKRLKQLIKEIPLEQNKIPKLHQLMFQDCNFDGVFMEPMGKNVKVMYQKYHHPLGSQIGHDANGLGINLNANNFLNPGLHIGNQDVIWGNGPRNNLKNYLPGPLGTPCLNKNNFCYAPENLVLEKMISDSYQSGNYLGCLLYHGTGGMIFYKPFKDLMVDSTYHDFLEYNQELANLYQEKTNYRLLDASDTTGYGDYLRRTYPGVLLIELSKMGGNPIGPYGDIQNIHQVFRDNTEALHSILGHFQEVKQKKKILI